MVDIDSASEKSAMGHQSREMSLPYLICSDMIPEKIDNLHFCCQINGQHAPINALLSLKKAYALEHL